MTTAQLRFEHKADREFPCRLGILSMIICLATGISSIFTTHPTRIIFCALAMYVFRVLLRSWVDTAVQEIPC